MRLDVGMCFPLCYTVLYRLKGEMYIMDKDSFSYVIEDIKEYLSIRGISI